MRPSQLTAFSTVLHFSNKKRSRSPALKPGWMAVGATEVIPMASPASLMPSSIWIKEVVFPQKEREGVSWGN